MLIHRHNYHLYFEDQKHPLHYTLRCRCGRVVPDISTAIKEMRKPMQTSPTVVAIIAAILAAGFVAILATFHPHPAVPATDVHESKGDMERHIRIIPIVQPQVVDAEPTKIPVVQPVEPPRISYPADPAVHKNPVAQNICDRTGGRKVETNNGRSWHCEYNHRN
jgi:hypothetical protein